MSSVSSYLRTSQLIDDKAATSPTNHESVQLDIRRSGQLSEHEARLKERTRGKHGARREHEHQGSIERQAKVAAKGVLVYRHERVYGVCRRCRKTERSIYWGRERRRERIGKKKERGRRDRWPFYEGTQERTRIRRRVNRACNSCSSKWIVDVNVARGLSLIKTQKSRTYPGIRGCN